MRKWLLALLLVCPVFAAGLDDDMQTAIRLPPRQACEALGRLRDEAASAGRQADFDKAMAAALFRYEVDREASLPSIMADRRQLQLEIPPGPPTSVKVSAAWPEGVVSPDGNLQLLRTPTSLQVATQGGVVLMDMPPPPDTTLKAYAERFAPWRTKHALAYGNVCWSVDALHMVWSVDGVICLGSLDGKVRAVSTPGDAPVSLELWDENPICSPTDRSVIYTRYARDRMGRMLEPRAMFGTLQGEKLLSPGTAVGYLPVPGKTERVLVLGGETLYAFDPSSDEGGQKIASGVSTAASSVDGSLVCVVHTGRVGIVPVHPPGAERAVALPTGAQVAQPPAWVSPVSVALTLRFGSGASKRYEVWLLDVRGDGELKQLTEGYLWPWNHNARQIATSAGLLQLTY